VVGVAAARTQVQANSSCSDPERNVMIARINSVHTATDKLAGLVKFSEERLPDAREAPGFKGFYLLADHQSGKIVSISLWESDADLRRFETRGIQARTEASSELGIAPTPVDTYEVVLQA
jgi:heme-degrading monooxygenase HmoA